VAKASERRNKGAHVSKTSILAEPDALQEFRRTKNSMVALKEIFCSIIALAPQNILLRNSRKFLSYITLKRCVGVICSIEKIKCHEILSFVPRLTGWFFQRPPASLSRKDFMAMPGRRIPYQEGHLYRLDSSVKELTQ